jgi:hypothetical protein
MLNKLLLFALLTVGFYSNAQDKLTTPTPPRVTVAELSQKTHPQDSTASAAYLYKYGKTWYELVDNYWVMVTEVYNRIKIYKKEGYGYANPHIDYYSGNKKGRGSFSEANTYNLVGGTLEKTALQKGAEFEEQLQEDYTRKKINLPNVREGSVVEFKYTIRTPYFGELRDFYFQYNIPVNDARYDLWIPKYFYYNVYTVGYIKIRASESQNVYNRATQTDDKYTNYIATNIKPIKDEAYVSNIDNYTSMVKHELAAIAMPNQQPEYYATDWKMVARKIYEHEKFGRELRHNAYFEPAIDPLIPKTATDIEKANAIFNYVKAYMNWNSENSYVCDVGVKKAYESKVGNTAEINLMLTAMLRYAGLDANPVLVSTRANGVAIFPTRYAYNYVIAAVKIDGKTLLLDATSKYAQPNVMPIRVLNWQGRLIKRNGDTEEIDLMPTSNSREVINIIAEMAPNGTLTGKVRDQYLDYRAFIFRENYADMSEDSYLEELEKTHKGLSVIDYKVTNKKDASKPLIEDYNFTHNMVSDVIGGKIYFNPTLFFTYIVNPFKQESREYPVNFVYPKQDKYSIIIKIPPGYKVESFPKPIAIGMEQNIGSFKYNISAQDTHIQISMVFEINYSSISADYYKTLKDFFQKMIEKQTEKIVLVKA